MIIADALALLLPLLLGYGLGARGKRRAVNKVWEDTLPMVQTAHQVYWLNRNRKVGEESNALDATIELLEVSIDTYERKVRKMI